MKLELGKLKFELKRELVPICVFYFFLLLCFGLIQPYFTLQLRTLGLTLDDAALVGESPLSPILGMTVMPYWVNPGMAGMMATFLSLFTPYIQMSDNKSHEDGFSMLTSASSDIPFTSENNFS